MSNAIGFLHVKNTTLKNILPLMFVSVLMDLIACGWFY
jgi:hypothetical protein